MLFESKVPRIVVVVVDEPMDNVPVVKLSQMVNGVVELFACILVVYIVPVII
jgi:hypothetical protein